MYTHPEYVGKWEDFDTEQFIEAARSEDSENRILYDEQIIKHELAIEEARQAHGEEHPYYLYLDSLIVRPVPSIEGIIHQTLRQHKIWKKDTFMRDYRISYRVTYRKRQAEAWRLCTENGRVPHIDFIPSQVISYAKREGFFRKEME